MAAGMPENPPMAVEELRIDTSSGDACAATLYRPTEMRTPSPCVVMGAGGTLTRRDGIPDFARRFAAAGIAALTFDYRHWGDSEGEPRRLISVPDQLADWRTAVACARGFGGIDADRIATWGMSFGGGHALLTAAEDARIAAVVAFVPMADGLAFSRNLRVARLSGRVFLAWLKGQCLTCPAVGPGSPFPPDALASFQRLAGSSGWRNEVRLTFGYPVVRYRPVRRAAAIQAPVLAQLGEDDDLAPRRAIERTAERAPRGELRRYPIDHFSGFWPECADPVAGDQVDFLLRHLRRA